MRRKGASRMRMVTARMVWNRLKLVFQSYKAKDLMPLSWTHPWLHHRQATAAPLQHPFLFFPVSVSTPAQLLFKTFAYFLPKSALLSIFLPLTGKWKGQRWKVGVEGTKKERNWGIHSFMAGEPGCQGDDRKNKLEQRQAAKNVWELGCEILCLRKHCSVLELRCSMMFLVLTEGPVICYQKWDTWMCMGGSDHKPDIWWKVHEYAVLLPKF